MIFERTVSKNPAIHPAKMAGRGWLPIQKREIPTTIPTKCRDFQASSERAVKVRQLSHPALIENNHALLCAA
jgi:hypothetical protein